MRRLSAFLVLAFSLSFVLVAGPSAANGPPRTRASSTPVGAGPVAPGFPIDHLGVIWSGHAEGGYVRFHHRAGWGPWIRLVPDGIEEPGGFASGPVRGEDADAYQVRVPSGAREARAVAIDTTNGRRGSTRGAAAAASTPVTARAEWGADESLMTWQLDYYAAQKLTAHHTATANDDPDPAATVRAIYRYHAVDRGWGDIGYQYLIDESGRVYEGRWSGTDGDPAHSASGAVVTAAHVGGYNSGNVGVALLGTLSSRAPTAAARSALEGILRDLSTRHGIDPHGTGTYTNPANGVTKTVPNISGHRDWEATECPGGALYSELPSIRAAVAGGTAPGDTTAPIISNVRATPTRSDATISWSTDEPATSQIEWRRSGTTSSTLTPVDSTLTRSHTQRVSGLAARTKYQYRVRSADAAGNTAVSVWYSFTTTR